MHRVKSRGLVVALFMAVALASVVRPAAADAAYYMLQARHSNQCLDVFNFSQANRAGVVQWDCWGGANQQWEAISYPGYGGAVALRARHSGKCLEVYDFASHDGADVVQWDCWGGSNQMWKLETGRYFDEYFVTVRNFRTNKCLDVSQISQARGAKVYQWSCWGGKNQQWRMLPVR